MVLNSRECRKQRLSYSEGIERMAWLLVTSHAHAGLAIRRLGLGDDGLGSRETRLGRAVHFLDESGSLLGQTAELRPGDKVSNGGRGYLRHGCDLVGFVEIVVENLLSKTG